MFSWIEKKKYADYTKLRMFVLAESRLQSKRPVVIDELKLIEYEKVLEL